MVQQIEEGKYTTKKAASNRVRFTGSIREVIYKVAALTDAPRAIGTPEDWEEWEEDCCLPRTHEGIEQLSPDVGYEDFGDCLRFPDTVCAYASEVSRPSVPLRVAR